MFGIYKRTPEPEQSYFQLCIESLIAALDGLVIILTFGYFITLWPEWLYYYTIRKYNEKN